MPEFLYVEDDQMSREVMQVLMDNVLGYPLTVFETSANFRERFQALPHVPDVIFLDIHMEPLDGFEVLAIIRETSLKVTIIAMTASVMALDVEKLKVAGFNGMIGKPIRNRIFPELLEKILAGEAVWFIA